MAVSRVGIETAAPELEWTTRFWSLGIEGIEGFDGESNVRD
jgi:hypothetical protein